MMHVIELTLTLKKIDAIYCINLIKLKSFCVCTKKFFQIIYIPTCPYSISSTRQAARPRVREEPPEAAPVAPSKPSR